MLETSEPQEAQGLRAVVTGPTGIRPTSEAGFRSAWLAGTSTPNMVLDSHWKVLCLDVESLSNSALGRNDLRDFGVFPSPPCDNQPEMLKPAENLAWDPSLLFSGTRHHGDMCPSLQVLLLGPHWSQLTHQ